MCVKGFHADVQRNAILIGWLMLLLVCMCIFSLSLARAHTLTRTHARWVVSSDGMALHIQVIYIFYPPRGEIPTIASVFVERQRNI